jgi:GTP-binding protein HflX
LERDEYDKIRRVSISAQTGVGLDLLREAIAEYAKNDTGEAAIPSS